MICLVPYGIVKVGGAKEGVTCKCMRVCASAREYGNLQCAVFLTLLSELLKVDMNQGVMRARIQTGAVYCTRFIRGGSRISQNRHSSDCKTDLDLPHRCMGCLFHKKRGGIPGARPGGLPNGFVTPEEIICNYTGSANSNRPPLPLLPTRSVLVFPSLRLSCFCSTMNCKVRILHFPLLLSNTALYITDRIALSQPGMGT